MPVFAAFPVLMKMVSVAEFRDNYLRLCKDHHIDPQECVIQQIKCAQQNTNKGGLTLDLSTHSLTVKTCAVLAKVLATDRAFSEIKFNDCMLPEEGVKALAHGLASNVTCKKLELKGNNIRASATEALGRTLKQNTTLLSLCLEWNSMGMLDAAFGIFCEGLGSNARLQMLDLRNNQVTHDGAAELGAALKRNMKLKALDLRWNSVGLIGGRSLINMLQMNRNIIKLELAGNNIPNDVLKAIDAAIGHNQDRNSVETEHMTRQKMLSEQLQQVKKDKQSEITDLLDRLDRQDAMLRKSTRSTQDRVAKLQEALEDRKAQFHDMAAKVSMMESELALSENKLREMTMILANAKEEQAEAARQHHSELKRNREEKALMESRLNKDILELTEKNLHLENKLDEAELKCRGLQEQIYELKETLAHTQADAKMKASQCEEKIAQEKQRSKEAIRDADEIRQKELDRLRHEAEENDRQLKERIAKLEGHRMSQDEEISRLKAAVQTEKLNAEESLLHAKQRIKAEDEQRYQQLEERLRVAQSSRDELQSHSTQQASLIGDLQSKNANFILENETLRHKIEALQADLSGKNNEMVAEVGKAKLELQQRIQKLESERQTHQELYDKINRLERDLAELQAKHKSVISEKEIEIAKLSERLKARDAEIQHMRQEDTQRSNMLQSAIQSYVTRSPFSASS